MGYRFKVTVGNDTMYMGNGTKRHAVTMWQCYVAINPDELVTLWERGAIVKNQYATTKG